MNKNIDLLDVDLALFDGGDGGGEGGTQAGSVGTQQGNTGEGQAGKAAAGKGSDAGSETNDAVKAETPKEREARYRALVNGEFKDLFTADTQRIIDRRFKETKGLQESLAAQQPVLDRLMARYNIQDLGELAKALESDDAAAQAAADKLGMSLEQFRAVERANLEKIVDRRERAAMAEKLEAIRKRDEAGIKLQRWAEEAVAMSEKYPGFDLEKELEDPEFGASLDRGMSMEEVYKILHYDRDVEEHAKAAAAERERAVQENIRAGGRRPAENASGAQNPVATVANVSAMTKEERAEIARRAMRGEKNITLR